MSNERIDEFLSWRGRLEDSQESSGQELADREAVWERLIGRIAETPRRRRFFGYRLAAACVLLALVPAILLFTHRHARIVAMRPPLVSSVPVMPPGDKPKQPEQPGSPQGHNVAHAPGVAREPGVLQESGVMHETGVRKELDLSRASGLSPKSGVTHERARRVITAPERRGKPWKRVPQPEKQQLAKLGQRAPLVTIPTILPDSATALLIKKPLKVNSLRVVHINELPGNAGPSPAVTTSGANKHFAIFLAPSELNLSSPKQ